MQKPITDLIHAYDPSRTLEHAATIPSAWYLDPRIADLERRAVFGNSWQPVGRADQLREPGRFVTADIAGEPIVVTRGSGGRLHGCYNVCRHHAAIIATQPEGACSVLRCPYHGWTYDLDGRLKGAPEFEGVLGFDKSANGLVPVRVETWEDFVFVNLGDDRTMLIDFLGDLAPRVAKLNLSSLRFFERRSYTLNCNWKVYVDNYLDGGYHVPHLHKGLNTVLEYSDYQIETKDRFCLQWSPMKSGKGERDRGASVNSTAAVRRGDAAYYYWLYPNFMLNWYEGVMDTNRVLPLGVDRCQVIFDFYFGENTSEDLSRRSVAVGERVQQEDVDICESVQRGLASTAYDVGRLSVRREAGEHLFHRLLFKDLSAALH